MLENCCAFTGHRPHKFPWKENEADSRCVALKAVLLEQIAALVDVSFTQFLSGMAEGTDTWSALSALDLREESRDQAPLYPPLQGAGGQVVSFIAGPLSFYPGSGGFHCLRQQDLLQKLYAGPQPLFGGPHRRSAGRL